MEKNSSAGDFAQLQRDYQFSPKPVPSKDLTKLGSKFLQKVLDNGLYDFLKRKFWNNPLAVAKHIMDRIGTYPCVDSLFQFDRSAVVPDMELCKELLPYACERLQLQHATDSTDSLPKHANPTGEAINATVSEISFQRARWKDIGSLCGTVAQVQVVLYIGHGTTNGGAWWMADDETRGLLDTINGWWDSNEKDRHLVIVSDSCFSGRLVEALRDIKSQWEQQLKTTGSSVTVQSSCGGDQVAEGNFFMPAWLWWNSLSDDCLQMIKSFAQQGTMATADPGPSPMLPLPRADAIGDLHSRNECLPTLRLACTYSDTATLLLLSRQLGQKPSACVPRGPLLPATTTKLLQVLKKFANQIDNKRGTKLCGAATRSKASVTLEEDSAHHVTFEDIAISLKADKTTMMFLVIRVTSNDAALRGSYFLHVHLKGYSNPSSFWSSNAGCEAVHVTELLDVKQWLVAAVQAKASGSPFKNTELKVGTTQAECIARKAEAKEVRLTMVHMPTSSEKEFCNEFGQYIVAHVKNGWRGAHTSVLVCIDCGSQWQTLWNFVRYRRSLGITMHPHGGVFENTMSDIPGLNNGGKATLDLSSGDMDALVRHAMKVWLPMQKQTFKKKVLLQSTNGGFRLEGFANWRMGLNYGGTPHGDGYCLRMAGSLMGMARSRCAGDFSNIVPDRAASSDGGGSSKRPKHTEK